MTEPIKCSLGEYLHDNCNKSTYVSKSSIYDVQIENKYILCLRTGVNVQDLTTICTHHEMEYLQYYGNKFPQCCNPLAHHTKVIKKNVTPITLDHHYLHKALIPGQKICCSCLRKLKKENTEEIAEIELEDDPDYTLEEVIKNKVENLNTSLTSFGLSPIKSKKRSSDQLNQRVKTKVQKLQETIHPDMSKSELAEISLKAESMDYFVQKLREKFSKEVNVSEKIKLLTLVPVHWTIDQTVQEFKTTQYIVRQARTLREEKGILGERIMDNKQRTLTNDTIKTVIQFYENEENARMLPGKKDSVSVQTEEGKIQKQKMLVLYNLKELYEFFKMKHPEIKIGFSSFASLRPKWCVLAGAAGTHTVCVCILHQNPKLKIQACDGRSTISELMAHGVCSMVEEGCMMHTCGQCPGEEGLVNALENITPEKDSIEYRQWVSTDRCTLMTIQEPRLDFISNLAADLFKLTQHHYIAKSQSNYFTTSKEEMNDHEAIVQLDYSENFTMVYQDAIQSSYFDGRQATVHPYVVYFKNNGLLDSKSYCVISNHMQHDSTAVSIFNQKIVADIKNNLPWLTLLHYWSDGSAAQYKNRFVYFKK